MRNILYFYQEYFEFYNYKYIEGIPYGGSSTLCFFHICDIDWWFICPSSQFKRTSLLKLPSKFFLKVYFTLENMN